MEELQKLLEQNLEYSKRNYEILRKMESRDRLHRFGKFLYYAFIAALLVGGYIYAEPYIKRLSDTYQSAADSLQQAKDAAQSVTDFGKNLGGVKH